MRQSVRVYASMAGQDSAPPNLPAGEQVRLIALELFVNQGFNGVSVRKLASAIGVQAGSLYNHFDSKQALLYELIEDFEEALLFVLRKQVCRDQDPRRAVRSFVDAYIRFLLANHLGAALTRFEFRSLSPSQQQHIAAVRRRYHDLLGELIREGMRRRLFALGSVVATVHTLISMLDGAPDCPLTDGSSSIDWLIEHFQSLVLNALAVERFASH
ncbi:TetR/AcrR family transcriptional regulator [Pseudomonas benzenivorans]|uniref:TetR/AcrR family transcriptional regulator n=1 Tax=Pseudomonas benzenivorans TaxID=556533 RepID=A0ABZ0PYF2_9PSED|nr:TetR/AcrR family transcriptional regulator [Pseudomonas benzenivorans]WPC06243.1 TetR/AcrR family transcriptional regulator [Pseudomonas benzenivorans]